MDSYLFSALYIDFLFRTFSVDSCVVVLPRSTRMDERRRSGQIPAFGNWDQANELPITQYFESARQAGLIRECGHPDKRGGDLYASEFNKPSRNLPHPAKTRMREKRGTHAKEQRKQGKVCDVAEPARKHRQPPQPTVFHKNKISQYSHKMDTLIVSKVSAKPPKAIDEDLYKISPELLRSSKRFLQVFGVVPW
uniref:RIN4 pathogenic type III effector avirulence factor Avr cleavage site domain-containing protein n=1 Tax=Salix viminalis TaxID=40686 RepID=A0A6N2KH77_SALVM